MIGRPAAKARPETGALDADVTVRLGNLDLAAALRVDAGEVVAVLGPNGAGKSTLLRTLAGLVPPAAGRVTLDGRVLDDPAAGVRVAAPARNVGVTFQDYLLFAHLSARDNVAFGPRSRGRSRAEARRIADEWLERVGLADDAGTRPRALSGGQQQRVALARALATDPALLLLDEPLSALDVEARQALRRELRAHLAAFAGPVVLVTHEPLEAVTLADRLVVLEQGRVVQAGTVADVTSRPRSEWVARLAGVNLVRGRSESGTVELDGGGRLIAASAVAGDVLAVVRPQAVSLHRERPGGTPRNVWQGEVAAIEPVGERVRVQVTGRPPIVAEVTQAAVAELGLGAGGTVWVAVKASEVDLYPA